MENQDKLFSIQPGAEGSIEPLVNQAGIDAQQPKFKMLHPPAQPLKNTINFWEGQLIHDKWLMGPTTIIFVESTIAYLKCLEELTK